MLGAFIIDHDEDSRRVKCPAHLDRAPAAADEADEADEANCELRPVAGNTSDGYGYTIAT
jgi:hypothetical protein